MKTNYFTKFCVLLLLGLTMFTVYSCSTNKEEPFKEQLTLSITMLDGSDVPSILTMQSREGTLSLSVASNSTWEVIKKGNNTDWITVTPSGGKENGEIKITVTSNPNAFEREVIISFSVNNEEDFTSIKVMQEKKVPPTLPVIETIAPTELTQTSAITGGEVISDGGGDQPAKRGVCYSSSNKEPTINDEKTLDGSGAGSFVSTITGLKPKTVHYFRAYATNSIGTSYGEVFQSPPTVVCEGQYRHHLQGVTGNRKDLIYWSFTSTLVKTNLKGDVLQSVDVPYHSGDLCYFDNKVYVAYTDKWVDVNAEYDGKPADSKVYIYNADDLSLNEVVQIPELIYGAGGMEYYDDHFYVVGSLPVSHDKNLVYQYDKNFNHVRTHEIATGYTEIGIQTVCFNDNHFWFTSYTGASNKNLFKVDTSFNVVGSYNYYAAEGFLGWGEGWFLKAEHFGEKWHARVVPVLESSF